MADLRTSYILDLQGNLDRRARQYGRAFNRMSRTGRRDLGRLRRATAQLGNGLDRLGNRYTALITGVGGAAAGRFLVKFQSRMNRLGIDARATAERIEQLRGQVFEIARDPDIRINPNALLDAIDAIVEKTGDLEFAERNLRNLGLAISSSGAQGEAIGQIVAELQKLGVTDPGNLLQILDTLTKQGRSGAFTLEKLAALGPRVVTAYSAAVAGARSPVAQMRELGAALQTIRQSTGSAEQAATAFEAVLSTVVDPAKLKMLRQLGVQVFDPEGLKEGKEQLRPINELMVEILDKSGGRATILGRIFDREAIRAFSALRTDPKLMEKFFNEVGRGGQITAESARAASDMESALTSINTALKQSAIREFGGSVEALADALDRIDQKTLDRIIKAAGYGALGIGGLVVGRKLFKLGRGAAGLFRRRGGGMGGGVGGAVGGMAGVQRVWVVNMPGGRGGRGGMPGAGGRGARARRGPGARRLGRFGMLRRAPNLRTIGTLGAGAMGTAGLAVGAAGAGGYGVGTVLNKAAIEGSHLGDKIGEGIANLLAAYGVDSAQRAVERMERAAEGMERAAGRMEQSESFIRLGFDESGRVQLRGLESRGRDVDVYAGPLMAGSG